MKQIAKIKNKVTKIIKRLLQITNFSSIKTLVLRNKYLSLLIAITMIFIGKNCYDLILYKKEIKELNISLHEEQKTNKIMKSNIKYYSSDEFIIRYAIEELSLRPTKENKLIHIPVLPPTEDSFGEKKDELENSEQSVNPNENSNEVDTENSTQAEENKSVENAESSSNSDVAQETSTGDATIEE